MHRVLVVEDEETVARALERSLKRLGAEVRLLFDTSLLETTLLEFRPTHVVSDLRMTPLDGIAVLSLAKRLVPEARRTVLSGSIETISQGMLEEILPCRLVSKPWRDSTLGVDLGLEMGKTS